jgi:hypothetical protein
VVPTQFLLVLTNIYTLHFRQNDGSKLNSRNTVYNQVALGIKTVDKGHAEKAPRRRNERAKEKAAEDKAAEDKAAMMLQLGLAPTQEQAAPVNAMAEN